MDVDVAEEVTVSDVNLTIKDDESEQDDEEEEGEKWRKKFPSPKTIFENFVKSKFLRTQCEIYGILLWEQIFCKINFCMNQKECKMISRKDFLWEWIVGYSAI